MNEYQFYFAGMMLKIESERELLFNSDEELFMECVLPVVDTAYIQVRWVEELAEIPEGMQQQYYDDEMYVHTDGQREIRSYVVKGMNEEKHLYARSIWEENRVLLELLQSSTFVQRRHPHVLTLIHLEKMLLRIDCLLLHSCFMEYRGEAILFTAPSGTGKTTQGKLWERFYNSRIVNGDKCLLHRNSDGKLLGCGYFVHGSAKECENVVIPIKAIVVVRQYPCDEIRELRRMERVSRLYSESTINRWDVKDVDRSLNLLADIVVDTPVIEMGCTMNRSAADVLHKYLYGECDGII